MTSKQQRRHKSRSVTELPRRWEINIFSKEQKIAGPVAVHGRAISIALQTSGAQGITSGNIN